MSGLFSPTDLVSHLLILLILLSVVLIWREEKRRRQLLPPGPKGLPFIGNALDIPTEQPWLKYVQWGKEFGDVVYLSALGQPMIILNSAKAVFDLLDRRSANYSDRPHIMMASELAGYGDCPPLSAYGPQHREYRKLLAEILTPRRIQDWQPLEAEHVHELVSRLLQTPEKFLHHIRRTIACITFEISHGHLVAEENDPLLQIAEQGDHDFSELIIPGAFLVDSFPILRHIPDWTGVRFKKQAKEYRKTMEKMRDMPYEYVKDQVARGIARPSFTSSLIERKEKPTPEEEYTYKWASTGLYSAGADTSVSALAAFVLAMSMNPEVQRKAQEEIDAVIGANRLPTFQDRPNLPYINAIIKEVYRHNPVAPFAIPHRVMEDDIYRGWKIPKGAIVVPNSWGILHNPEMYPSPEKFMPERYLSMDAKEREAKNINPDPSKFAFGYGRRACPGEMLADNTIYFAIVTILSVCNIGALTSEVPKFGSGAISHPDPFKCPITPRSEQAIELITRQ